MVHSRDNSNRTIEKEERKHPHGRVMYCSMFEGKEKKKNITTFSFFFLVCKSISVHSQFKFISHYPFFCLNIETFNIS